MVHPVKSRPFQTSNYLEATSTTTTQQRTLSDVWIDAGVPKWVTLLDEFLFVVASIMFVQGSFDFLPGVAAQKYLEGCTLFIVGSGIYLTLAIFASYEVIEDAKLQDASVDPLTLVEQTLYVIGSVTFLVGTVLFTPDLKQVAAEEQAATSAQQLTIDFFGREFSFASGALPEVPDANIFGGDELFVTGSVLFSVAAFVSALLAAGETAGDPTSVLRRRTSIACASLYELGGVAFVVGTLGFIPASTIGISACPDGANTLQYSGGMLYVAGSVCYLVGATLTLGFQVWKTYWDLDEQEVEQAAVPAQWRRESESGGKVVPTTMAAEAERAQVGEEVEGQAEEDEEVSTS